MEERARESTLGRANPDFRMCCSRLLSLTGGCNSHREECKTLIGPPTLVQCFGRSWRLTCIIVVAVHFFTQSETMERGVMNLRIAIGLDKRLLPGSLSGPCGEERPLRAVAVHRKLKKLLGNKHPDCTRAPFHPCQRDVEKITKVVRQSSRNQLSPCSHFLTIAWVNLCLAFCFSTV